MTIELIHSERGFANEIRRYKVTGISGTTKEKLIEISEIAEVVDSGYIRDVDIKSDHFIMEIIDSHHDLRSTER